MTAPRFDEWIARAEEDYRAVLALDPGDLPAIVCYHAQQCAEKYLKAMLVLHCAEPPRTHDLIELSDLVEETEPRIGEVSEQLHVLTPYSVSVRYPGMHVTSEDAMVAREVLFGLRTRFRAFLGLDPPT
ncbi:MAG: HEPN domain-containing protein [Armatimonadetes bacterium]|nr:HEPN domain-containing protein [Armatimonadota bacterium]